MLTVEMWAFLSGFSCPTTILLLLSSISLGPGEVTHSNYLVGKGLRRGVRRLQQFTECYSVLHSFLWCCTEGLHLGVLPVGSRKVTATCSLASAEHVTWCYSVLHGVTSCSMALHRRATSQTSSCEQHRNLLAHQLLLNMLLGVTMCYM